MPVTETGKKLMAAVTKEFLVIEDSTTIRGFLKKALEGAFENCVVHEAEEGKTAVKELTQSRVHLIITDLNMPGMSGTEFLNILSKNPILAKKPVIVLSGEDLTALKKEFEDRPHIVFMKKPTPREEITKQIKILLGLE